MSIYPVQTQTFNMAANGAVAGSTTITLQSFKDILGSNLTMTSFGSIGYGTIEPNTTNEDSISFTGITQNADGTATLTGVNSVLFVQPFTTGTGLRVSHAGSVPFIITNTAAFTATYANKNNVEAITTNWSIPDPVSSTDIANKQWVLTQVAGGAVSFEKVIVAGTAGENVTAGQLVYLKASDSKWWKADADLTATVDNIQLGLTQGSGSSNGAITDGVLVSGMHTTTGLTANSLYYASNTAGGISTTTGTLTKVIGQAISTTKLLFNPNFYTNSTSNPTAYITTSAGVADAGKGVKTNANGVIDSTLTSKVTDITEFTSSGTWTKDPGLDFIEVYAWGAGGSGGSGTTGGGGGGGSCVVVKIQTSALGATETVTIGDGGTTSTNADGKAGGNTTFGSLVTAYGGGGGLSAFGGNGGGGGGTTSAGATATSTAGGGGGGTIGGAGGINAGGSGGDSTLGGGGGSGGTGAYTGGASIYGGGGGGSEGSVGGASLWGGAGGAGGSGTAGTSKYGGNGGAAANIGVVPGGGGGGNTSSGASGAGAKGKVIVYEFYKIS